jgi:uncharacterized membrane protein YozB (DUF420 family)
VIQHLPTVNACLNGTAALLLVAGYAAIRRGNREAHIRFMVAALAASTLFLASYLTYHFNTEVVTKYAKHDWTRPVYFAILISHTILAVVILPLVILTVVRAARKQFDKHRRIARITLPVWLYVSVTGVAIYLMLYVF